MTLTNDENKAMSAAASFGLVLLIACAALCGCGPKPQPETPTSSPAHEVTSDDTGGDEADADGERTTGEPTTAGPSDPSDPAGSGSSSSSTGEPAGTTSDFPEECPQPESEDCRPCAAHGWCYKDGSRCCFTCHACAETSSKTGWCAADGGECLFCEYLCPAVWACPDPVEGCPGT